MPDAKIIQMFPRSTTGTIELYHYCSIDFHLANCVGWNDDGSLKRAIVTERMPDEYDDRELLFELSVGAKHLQVVGPGAYLVAWPLATSTPHRVSRVTYWHLCTKWRHSRICRKSEGCLVQTQRPMVAAGKILIRVHPQDAHVQWVVENQLLGKGHHEVMGKVFD